MKIPFRTEKINPLDDQIAYVLKELTDREMDEDIYPKLLTLLERLYKVKTEECRKPVSWDTIVIVGGNILGILIIVAYEQTHVLTSKGMNQLVKPR